jgi:hypothetical protein
MRSLEFLRLIAYYICPLHYTGANTRNSEHPKKANAAERARLVVERAHLVLDSATHTVIAITASETVTMIETVVAMVGLADTAPAPALTPQPVAKMERESG